MRLEHHESVQIMKVYLFMMNYPFKEHFAKIIILFQIFFLLWNTKLCIFMNFKRDKHS